MTVYARIACNQGKHQLAASLVISIVSKSHTIKKKILFAGLVEWIAGKKEKGRAGVVRYRESSETDA
jgi:hypothetical protein